MFPNKAHAVQTHAQKAVGEAYTDYILFCIKVCLGMLDHDLYLDVYGNDAAAQAV